MKRWRYAAGGLVVLAVLLYSLGYRVSPLEAAKADPFIGSQVQSLAPAVSFSHGEVLLLDTVGGPRTALTRESLGFLWRTSVVTHFPRLTSEAVSTVGWMDYGHIITVLAVRVRSARVAAIAAGPPGQRSTQKVHRSQTVVFVWRHGESFSSLNPVALSNTGQRLYRYRYPNRSSVSSSALRWYPVQ